MVVRKKMGLLVSCVVCPLLNRAGDKVYFFTYLQEM